MFEMDRCREEFQKAFPIPAHWIEFDEKTNRYYCPYVADAKAYEYQAQWVVWQHQQAKVDQLKDQLIKLGFTDNGGELMKPPLGKPPKFDLLDVFQAKVEELQKRVDKALKLMQKPVIVGEPSNYVCARFTEIEQALKGEG